MPTQPGGMYRGGGGIARLLRSRFGILLIAAVGLFLYWQMNQKPVPFSGRSQLNTVSIEQEVKLGQQSYLQILNQEQSQGNAVLCAGETCSGEDAELTEDVREIGARLQAAAVELEQELLKKGYAFTPVADKFDWTY
jgi:predicted Zn-dependent protease